MTARLAPVFVFLLVIGGGVLEIVGLQYLYQIAVYIVAGVLVILPPIGTLIYLITRLIHK